MSIEQTAQQLQTAPAEAAGVHTQTGIDNKKLALWLFIGSDCMFFGALLITYLVYEGASIVGPYPKDLMDIPLTTVSTFILLMSSLSMALAVSASARGDMRGQKLGLLATAVLGLIFLGFQTYEFNHFVHSGLTLSTNLFGSSFYVLTGIHGVHVGIGVFWILALLWNTLRGRVPQSKAVNVEIAGLYWHFVDVVWIVLFTVVYLIGAG